MLTQFRDHLHPERGGGLGDGEHAPRAVGRLLVTRVTETLPDRRAVQPRVGASPARLDREHLDQRLPLGPGTGGLPVLGAPQRRPDRTVGMKVEGERERRVTPGVQ